MSQVFAFLSRFDDTRGLIKIHRIWNLEQEKVGGLWRPDSGHTASSWGQFQRAPADHSEKQNFLSPTLDWGLGKTVARMMHLIVLNQSEEQDCHHLGFLTPIKRCLRSRCGYLFQGAAHNLSHIVQKRHYICSIQPWNELVPLKHLVKLRSLVRKRRHRLWGRQAGLKPLQADGKLKECFELDIENSLKISNIGSVIPFSPKGF